MKEIDLLNKKILYIGPASYYDKSLMNKMTELGASITFHDLLNFYSDNLFFRAAMKFSFKTKEDIYQGYKNKFYNRVLSAKHHDYVLVRHGYQFDTSFLKQLRESNPNAKFINFHWDSLRSDYQYLHTLEYYDKIFSFDVKDCRDYPKIQYLPLFFLDIYDDFRKSNFDNFKQKEIDLLFVGAWRNKERYDLITQTEDICKKNKLRFRHYLYLSFKRHLYTIKKGIIPKKAKMRELSHKQILDLFATTNTIIDFPSSFQTGLTIRTFETLGAGKKLITTNKNIAMEPFYHPEFISIVDMDNITVDVEFIKNTPRASIEDKLKDYSIGSYLNKLFQ
jgi:hypothetical protein